MTYVQASNSKLDPAIIPKMECHPEPVTEAGASRTSKLQTSQTLPTFWIRVTGMMASPMIHSSHSIQPPIAPELSVNDATLTLHSISTLRML